MKQHPLQVDRLVAPVKQVPQVAEFPARPGIDQQHVGARLGNRCLKRPAVVVPESLARHRVDLNLIDSDPALRGKVQKLDLLAVAVRRDGDCFFSHPDAIAGESRHRLLALKTIEFQVRRHPHAVAEVDRIGRAHCQHGGIPRRTWTANGDDAERRIEHAKTPGAFPNQSRAVVPTIS